MTFTTDSALVIVWRNLIRAKKYTIDDVPAIGNLREAVAASLAETEASV